MAALRASRPREVHILLGGTLYLSDDRPPRAFCRQWPAGGGEPISFWTNIDLRHLQGLGRFIGTDGTHYQFMMMWSIMDIQLTTAALADTDRSYHPPVLPDFPNETPAAAGLPAALAGAATFIPAAGNADQAGDLTAITELHKIYNLERPRLCAAHIARENARLAAEAALKANPPTPQDITLHYWLKTDAPQIPANPVPPTPAVPPPSAPSPARPRCPSRRAGIPPTREDSLPGCHGRRASSLSFCKAHVGKHISFIAFALAAHLLTLLPAPADPAPPILDLNANGYSDIWELDVNNGALFPYLDPEADPDGDGWNNAHEHAAGTRPADPNPPAGIFRPELQDIPAHFETINGETVQIPRQILLTWTGIIGKRYTPLLSVDLGTWTPFSTAAIANGTPIVAGIEVDPAIPRHFIRVAVDDVDRDEDGLNDYEEHIKGTNPLSADTDSDGLNDKAELESPALYNPLDPDQDLDGILDGADGTPRVNNNETDPDGHLIPPEIATGLVGWWDFQDTPVQTSPPPALINRFLSREGAYRQLLFTKGSSSHGSINGTAGGTAAATPGRAELLVLETGSPLIGSERLALAYWIKLVPGCLAPPPYQPQGPPVTLLAYSNIGTARPTYEWQAVRLRAGGTRFALRNYPGAYPADLFPAGQWDSPIALDDGKWHHLAINIGGTNATRMFLDGAQTGNTYNLSLTIPNNAPQYDAYLLVGGTRSATTFVSDLKGSIDGLLARNSPLPPETVYALYHRDRDSDGTRDRDECNSPVWRDAPPYGQAAAAEYKHISSPDHWDDPNGDSDADGLSNLSEIAAGTDPGDPDTDGDLIPDGWEQNTGLDPKSNADAGADPDGDLLTNLDEYRHGTSPNNPDSDNDGANDLAEILGPDGIRQNPVDPSAPGAVVTHDDATDPNDPADNPSSPRPASSLVEFKLGVGDRSGSHSEDYVLNVFRITPGTVAEERVYTLRSGGHGQYAEIFKSFRKGETYTFQIQWLGTSNATGTSQSDSADWDYHLVVEPQGADTGGMLIDSYTPAPGRVDTALAARILDTLDEDPDDDNDDNITHFPNTLQKKRVLFYSIKPLSADRMFGGAATILPGLERMEFHITQPASGRDFGTHGYLLGGGPTPIYTSLRGMIGAADNGGADVEDPTVWFLNDTGGRFTEFYLIADPAMGAIRIEASLAGSHLGTFEHTLTPNADFSQMITTLVDMVAGTGMGFDPAAPTLGDGVGLSNPSGWATPALIPVLAVAHQVENLTIFYQGLLSGVIGGLRDDWEFLKLIYSGAVAAGNWSYQHALAELQRWRTDPMARLEEIKELLDNAFDEHVCKPLAGIAEEASTLEGFKKLVWKAVPYLSVIVSPTYAACQALNTATGVDLRQKTAEAFVDWMDDFNARMLAGAERGAWLETPLSTDRLLSPQVALARECAFTFGHIYGYLSEQVVVGAVTGGVVVLGKVLIKGGAVLVGKLATRTAAMVAARSHVLKKWAASVAMTIEMKTAVERGLVEAARLPLTVTVKECPLEVLENAMMRSGYDRTAYGSRHLVDDLTTRPKLKDLQMMPGRESLLIHRAAQLSHLLGDECNDAILRNFMKVADETIVIRHADGTLDEFFEGFFRAFQGNPSLMTSADDATVSISSLSPEGKATLKKFLGDPNPGKLWDIDVPAIVDNEPAIPHNYWARGLLGELSIYKRVYKKAGYTHAPTAPAYDFISAAEYVQIKTLKNPDGAYNAMRKAVDALADLTDLAPPNRRTLHILKKPGSASDNLLDSLQSYIDEFIPIDRKVTVLIQEFELAP